MFHRRAYEFDFSEQEILAEARNFAKNVSTIEFVSKDEMYGDNNMGVYSPSNHTIRINQDYYMAKENDKGFSLAMYSTLVHEVYHAINYRENGDFGIIHQYKNGAISGSHMNEIVTESAATRTTMTKSNEDYQKGYMGTTGYQTTTCITNLLALAVGVSEKELC